MAAALLAAAIDVLYLSIIWAQHHIPNEPLFPPRVSFVAAMLAAAAVSAFAGSLPGRPLPRVALLVAAATILLTWGVLALFSIGLLLLIAALPALWAAGRVGRAAGRAAWPVAVAAAFAVLAITAAGLLQPD